MDSPRFTSLGFLLLTIAAPCPNIAMPSDNTAKGTQDYSFGKTNVTVYYCNDSESNVCQSSNYEACVIIGETDSKMFSNEKIHLVTNEGRINMCFHQENTIAEGIYAIVWEKDVGIGDSCGILNSGASSEIVRDNNNKICCEAKTVLSGPSPPLRCYAKTSGGENGRPTDDNIDEECLCNPQFSISEKSSSIDIIIPVLIVGLFAVALAVYCVRRKPNAQGPHIVFNQIFNEKTKWAADAENLTSI